MKRPKPITWDDVKAWNYVLPDEFRFQSLVYVELNSRHGRVSTSDASRIYYCISGSGTFSLPNQTISVSAGDLITIPPKTSYDYQADPNQILKCILLMEKWESE